MIIAFWVLISICIYFGIGVLCASLYGKYCKSYDHESAVLLGMLWPFAGPGALMVYFSRKADRKAQEERDRKRREADKLAKLKEEMERKALEVKR